MCMPETEKLAIGNWQERPATADERAPAEVQHTMAQRYANDMVWTSAAIKLEVVGHFHRSGALLWALHLA